LQAAESRGDFRTGLAGVREALRACETMAKLAGQIQTAPVTVNVTNNLLIVQTAILSALAPYPEARMAVVEALERIEAD
jgi:hypothetical protein